MELTCIVSGIAGEAFQVNKKFNLFALFSLLFSFGISAKEFSLSFGLNKGSIQYFRLSEQNLTKEKLINKHLKLKCGFEYNLGFLTDTNALHDGSLVEVGISR